MTDLDGRALVVVSVTVAVLLVPLRTHGVLPEFVPPVPRVLRLRRLLLAELLAGRAVTQLVADVIVTVGVARLPAVLQALIGLCRLLWPLTDLLLAHPGGLLAGLLALESSLLPSLALLTLLTRVAEPLTL